jgi:hypothetical protein
LKTCDTAGRNACATLVAAARAVFILKFLLAIRTKGLRRRFAKCPAQKSNLGKPGGDTWLVMAAKRRHSM